MVGRHLGTNMLSGSIHVELGRLTALGALYVLFLPTCRVNGFVVAVYVSVCL